MSTHPPTSEHNYLIKLRAFLAQWRSSITEGTHEASIDHDAWCDYLRDGRQYCNCDPDIRLRLVARVDA